MKKISLFVLVFSLFSADAFAALTYTIGYPGWRHGCGLFGYRITVYDSGGNIVSNGCYSLSKTASNDTLGARFANQRELKDILAKAHKDVIEMDKKFRLDAKGIAARLQKDIITLVAHKDKRGNKDKPVLNDADTQGLSLLLKTEDAKLFTVFGMEYTPGQPQSIMTFGQCMYALSGGTPYVVGSHVHEADTWFCKQATANQSAL